MDIHRIKMRIGPHEFEAEGSEEAVDRRLSIFKELVEQAGSAERRPISLDAPKRETADDSKATVDSPFTGIFKIEGKTVSLVAPPQGEKREGDAFLLVLLGQRIVRGCDWVLVGDVKAGLIDSGFSVTVIDSITDTIASELFMKKGLKRGKQFRLTNPGVQKAETLAREILASFS